MVPKLFSQNVSINATGNMPDSSAIPGISSTTIGFLMPGMTTYKGMPSSSGNGPYHFNTTAIAYQVNIGTAFSPSWSTLNSGAGSVWSLTGNTRAKSGSNFPGTIDNVSLHFKSSGVQPMIVDSSGSIGIGLSPTFSSGLPREKFLPDAGITTPYNAMAVQGSIDSNCG